MTADFFEMTMPQIYSSTKYLLIASLGLVLVHSAVVGLFGVKSPRFGVDQSVVTVSPERRVLETALAPPPKLSWSPPLDDKNLSAPSHKVNPVYVKSLPDMAAFSSEMRKKQFIKIMLPLILRANQEIEDRREMLLQIIDKQDLNGLINWGKLYGYKPKVINFQTMENELLKRVAPVPVSVALAQAAVESGWGTSRFAIQGNALFGQWAWNNEAGIKPLQPRFENAVIRKFDTLFGSVRAYMHNLNTHSAYKDFRNFRVNGADSLSLINTLELYAETRHEYIETLSGVITANEFLGYDNAILTDQ